MDLIDREELKEAILKWLPPDRCGEEDYGIPFEENIVVSVMMEIEEQPTVEAVPVVRCKDCRHHKGLTMSEKFQYGSNVVWCCNVYNITRILMRNDDFCSYGKCKE